MLPARAVTRCMTGKMLPELLAKRTLLSGAMPPLA